MDIDSALQAKESGLFASVKALLGKSRRVTHSLKVGIALVLVSSIYYWRPLYDGFGVAGMWAVLTVVAVFEVTVGATLSKGLNRGFATLLAGALGVGGQHLTNDFGEREKLIIHWTLVLSLVAGSTFSRFVPKTKARYHYVIVIFILTFNSVVVSGYRIKRSLELSHLSLSTIIIGGATCMFISLFVFPIWAGEDLQKLIASNIEKLVNYLQGFETEYFQCFEENSYKAKDDKTEKPALQEYKSILNSKETEETLANLAWWEPGHGRFRFRHPWKQYLKIGALVRKCAYKIEALNGYLNPDIPASSEFKAKVQESFKMMTSESSKALKVLSDSTRTMTDPSAAKSHVENLKTAIDDLKIALEASSPENPNLLSIVPVVTVASILVEITNSVEKIYESVCELSHLAHFKGIAEPNGSSEKPHLLHQGTIKSVIDPADSTQHVKITITEINPGSPAVADLDLNF